MINQRLQLEIQEVTAEM